MSILFVKCECGRVSEVEVTHEIVDAEQGSVDLNMTVTSVESFSVQLAEQSKQLDDAREQAGAFQAERDDLRARLEIATEALKEFEQWADGYANRVTGMGAGLHAEKWPMLGPGAYLEMLRLARAALGRIKGTG